MSDTFCRLTRIGEAILSQTIIAGFARLASAAGAAIMAVRARALASTTKPDGSPVTEADVAAEAIILSGLSELLPGVPVVAEEQAAAGVLAQSTGTRFLLVDPLDGTKEFVAGSRDFTVNIALVEAGRPVAGVVYAPALQEMYLAAPDVGARRLSLQPGSVPDTETAVAIAARPAPPALTALVSSRHFDAGSEAFLKTCPVSQRLPVGSSLKFCVIARGEADLYPRFGQTMEWDTAAGQAVLEAAGGSVLGPDGGPFRYGKAAQGYRNGPFIARGGSAGPA